MAKNLFIWLLIILLLISSGLLGLELLGRDEYRPSLKFGADKSQDIIEIKQKLQNIEDKLDKLENSQNSDKISQNNGSGALNSAGNAAGTTSGATNNPAQDSGSSNLIQQREFEACIRDGGKNEKGLASTLTSNLCAIDGINYRPSTFDLDQEVLTYLEATTATSGGKLNNAQNEVFIFSSGDATLFNTTTAKAGDKFKVTAKVSNNTGVYTFQTISKVEKVI